MFNEHLKRSEEAGFQRHSGSIQTILKQLVQANAFTQKLLVYSNIASSLGDGDWPRPIISDPSSFNTKSSSKSFDSR